MTVKIGHAASDESGKYSNGKAGDQTGKEVCIRTWYNRPWNKVVRPKNTGVALKIAKTCVDACNNNNIGYDQNQRTTLYTQAIKFDFDLTKITTPCECDCSSLVAVCVNAAGIKVSKDIYTGNMVAALKNTGSFDVLIDKKYLTSASLLKVGDILVYEGHHTAIVVDIGNGLPNIDTNTSYEEIKISTGDKGLKITASSLNIRETPNGTITGKSYKKDEYIFPTAKVFINGDAWLRTDLGWCSAKYVEGWVRELEADNRWWYVTQGYSYCTGIVEIDGIDYSFGNDGWLIQNSWFQIEDNWMYTDLDGAIRCSGWVLDDDKYYYLDENGCMVTDEFIIDNEKLYYLQSDGTMFEGELTVTTDENGALEIKKR